MAISHAKINQNRKLSQRSLSGLISLSPTILQLIILNIFININVWKHIVSSTSLSVTQYIPSASTRRGVVIKLKFESKKMRLPQYIRTIITKIWYVACPRIYLHVEDDKIILALRPMGSEAPSPSFLQRSVPIAIAPRTSIIRLTQSIWMTLSGGWPRETPPSIVKKQMLILIVN